MQDITLIYKKFNLDIQDILPYINMIFYLDIKDILPL